MRVMFGASRWLDPQAVEVAANGSTAAMAAATRQDFLSDMAIPLASEEALLMSAEGNTAACVTGCA
jgi:hypothetical protein